MIHTKDPEYNDALYGPTGTRTRCQCGAPADYLTRPTDQTPWTQGTGWCLPCAPRRGRRPHHGERAIRAWLTQSTCACGAPATVVMSAPQDPPISKLRRGQDPHALPAILSRATGYCDMHAPAPTRGRDVAAAAHPYANRALLREALLKPQATSYAAIARLLDVGDGGTTTRALLRNHAAHTLADPTFPPLPAPRTPQEWGAQGWAARTRTHPEC